MTGAPSTVAELAGADLGRRVVAYGPRDAILYALAVGATADELELVYERRLRVLPTFALPLGLWAVEAAGELGIYDRTGTLHVGQRLELLRPLPPEGRFETAARVAAVWDKGRAALVEIVAECEDFEATYTIYVPGAGGFGGERGPSAATPPAAAPELELRAVTHRDQAALYRLTGDLHPLHVDPAVARANGFARPILHGLCTLGCVARVLAPALDLEPWALTRVATRFAAPVLPGDALRLSGWRVPDGLRFRADVEGAVVLDDGLIA